MTHTFHYIFAYNPKTTMPELLEYHEQSCDLCGIVSNASQPMYRVRFQDGSIHEVFAEELQRAH